MEPTGTIREYKPTWRERAANALADLVEGMGADRWKANKIAQTLIGGERSNLPAGMGLSDLAAFGVVPGAPAALRAASVPAGLLNYADASKEGNPFSALTVWHGSPHKFDKFDSAHIGRGEGAQAYGYGMYFAENPGVAKSYQEQLTQGFQIDGRHPSVDEFQLVNGLLTRKQQGMSEAAAIQDMRAEALREIEKASASVEAAKQKIGTTEDAGPGWGALRFITGTKDDVAKAEQNLQKVRDHYARVSNLKPGQVARNEGSLYKVDLPDNLIARMLDWDKPLSQQAPEVREALEKAYKELGLIFPKKAATPKDGSGLYDDVAKGFNLSPNSRQEAANSRQLASDYLRELGIPGIRYLDGGSRGAGKGTYNYVVFPGEEDALTILERNGNPIQRLAR